MGNIDRSVGMSSTGFGNHRINAACRYLATADLSTSKIQSRLDVLSVQTRLSALLDQQVHPITFGIMNMQGQASIRQYCLSLIGREFK
jgi:hypothetical protein